MFPGENEAEQLACMIELLGVPPLKYINKASRKQIYFENDGRPKKMQNSKGRRRIPAMKRLSDVMKGAEEGFINLVELCLEWDQVKRITPDEALLHRWFQESSIIGRRNKHLKTQSESVIQINSLFTMKETELS